MVKQGPHLVGNNWIRSLAFSSIHDSTEVLFLRLIFIWLQNNIPTTLVVPKANPMANKVATSAGNSKGIIGRGSLWAALLHLYCVLPKGEQIIKTCKQGHNKNEGIMSATGGAERRKMVNKAQLWSPHSYWSRTVMVHLHHTSVTPSAETQPWWLLCVAQFTSLRLFQFPPQRGEARTNKHSMEVIIKNL